MDLVWPITTLYARPLALQHHRDLCMHLMFTPGSLSWHKRKSIAVIVSAAICGTDCVTHHLDVLRHQESHERMRLF